jgi:hypothetical protein
MVPVKVSRQEPFLPHARKTPRKPVIPALCVYFSLFFHSSHLSFYLLQCHVLVTGDCIVRIGMRTSYVPAEIAAVWGLDLVHPLIVEMQLSAPGFLRAAKARQYHLVPQSDSH